MTVGRVRFGVVVSSDTGELAGRVDRLGAILGRHFGGEVERVDASSYELLASNVREGRVDVAWLPPIVFVRLASEVTALGSIVRDGKSTYEAALVVRDDSRITTIEGLRGTRAGWVDRWSAAGFVLPRVKLALLGVDPRSAFRTETFHGSHRAVMQALAEGACDVAGTYARAGANGDMAAGGWSQIDGAKVRVLATFGAIPPDVIAARASFPEEARTKFVLALRAACAEESTRAAVRELFGGDELREGLVSGYESLRSALDIATARGLFD